MKTIFTIGHSNHSWETFLSMLQSFDIQLIADIRRFPSSKKFSHFNKSEMEGLLTLSSIQYRHLEELGGRRAPHPGSVNNAWRLKAFRGYADHMSTPIFQQAAHNLENLASEMTTAIMCSEAVWWSCHRSLVADFLKFKGWEVLHIMGISKSVQHPYTNPARIHHNELLYSLPESPK